MVNWLIKTALIDLMPRSGDIPGFEDTDYQSFFKRWRQDFPVSMVLGTALASFIYVIAPLFTVGIPVLSIWLPRRLRDLHAQRITYSPIYGIRQMMFLIKTVGGLCWGADPAVRKVFGYAPLPADPGTWRSE